jgi:decaprenylphospho-beta-D-ribofuranose 2-oxidase
MQLSQSPISHYANHRTVFGEYSSPTNIEDLCKTLVYAKKNGLRVCLLGAQNSFSDIFLGADQLHLSLLKMNRIVLFKPLENVLIVEPGVRIWEILQLIIPNGLYLTGLSGSYTDTMGGMISSNSFGKDSWNYGNSGDNVEWLKLVDANGNIHIAHKGDSLYNAAIGGLGMVGVIVEICFALKKIPSTILCTQNHPSSIQELTTFQLDCDFKYAWLDMSSNRSANCIIKTASFYHNSSNQTATPATPNNKVWGIPPKLFWKTLGFFWQPKTYHLVNQLLYSGQLLNSKFKKTMNYIDYYYPFRKYSNNVYIFKNNRFYEWQVLFSTQHFLTAFEQIFALMHQYKIHPIAPSIRWHRPTQSYLSFAGDGISLLVSFEDYLIDSSVGERFKADFFTIVLSNNGKTYLSKYPNFSADEIRKQYPLFDNFVAVKKTIDPDNLFLSDRALSILRNTEQPSGYMS